MKLITTIITSILLFTYANAQINNGFKYQAVARDQDNVPYQNQSMKLRFTLVDEMTMTDLYVEEHEVTTSTNGVFTTNIGEGLAIKGSIDEVAWGDSEYFLRVETARNGESFQLMGESRIQPVPTAKYAERAGNVDYQQLVGDRTGQHSLRLSLTNSPASVIINDIDSTNEIQDLTVTPAGAQVEIGLIGAPTKVRVDPSTTNELQEISIRQDPDRPENSLLKLTKGLFMPIPGPGFVDVEIPIPDTDPTNELQQLVQVPNGVLAPGNILVQLNKNPGPGIVVDEDASNELQNLKAMLTEGPEGLATEIEISRGNKIVIPDTDPQNELQDLEVVDRSATGGTAFVKLSKKDRIQSIDESDQNEIQKLDLKLINGALGKEAEIKLEHLSITPATRPFTSTIKIPDADPTNELQSLDFSNGILSLSKNGGSVSVPVSPWTTNTSGGISTDKTVNLDGFVYSSKWFEAAIVNAQKISTTSIALNSGKTKITPGNLTIITDQNFEGGIREDIEGHLEVRAQVVYADQIVTNNGTKHFRMDHPTDSNKEIYYCSIEGPEAAAYERGTSSLVGGEAFIPFSEHFSLIASPASMTTILTPLSSETLGLAVVEKSAKGIKVKELKGGTGNFKFDWEVKAVRKGFEDFEVVRNKK